MRIFAIILLFAVSTASFPLRANQITLEVEFDEDELDEIEEIIESSDQDQAQDANQDQSESFESETGTSRAAPSNSVSENIIQFGFAPSIFTGIPSLAELQHQNLAKPIMTAEEAIRQRKALTSKNKWYEFHMEKVKGFSSTIYLITITNLK